ncbi:hypothetical protein DFO66_1139 [Brevibacterium sanguinis]|uniref:Uncharacterized protein n=2 Tax=Brevibacterium TaxID=1696 RepID=A0A366IDW1_9MICO|nr:hypothetical protein DFO66_1139 [Brevibacterium sanguinis]RBP69311.1 hypothetical protein DFO65_1139 [Brevibacterium celere]
MVRGSAPVHGGRPDRWAQGCRAGPTCVAAGSVVPSAADPDAKGRAAVAAEGPDAVGPVAVSRVGTGVGWAAAGRAAGTTADRPGRATDTRPAEDPAAGERETGRAPRKAADRRSGTGAADRRAEVGAPARVPRREHPVSSAGGDGTAHGRAVAVARGRLVPPDARSGPLGAAHAGTPLAVPDSPWVIREASRARWPVRRVPTCVVLLRGEYSADPSLRSRPDTWRPMMWLYSNGPAHSNVDLSANTCGQPCPARGPGVQRSDRTAPDLVPAPRPAFLTCTDTDIRGDRPSTAGLTGGATRAHPGVERPG